jgi:hypothetical protein
LTKAPSIDELKRLKSFVDENKANLPPDLNDVLSRLLGVYSGFLMSTSRAKNTLSRLREAMGLTPKSERGGQVPTVAEMPPQVEGRAEELTPLQRELLIEIEKKRDVARRATAQYTTRIRKLKGKAGKSPQQLEFALECEVMFSNPPRERDDHEANKKVERMKEFGRDKGLLVTHDYTKRVDMKVLVTETTYKVETVTDPRTGKSVRASMKDEGPENYGVTWNAIANLVKMHVGFAIPINRLAAMIGQPEFRPSKICRLLQYVAINLLPIYFCLIESLSDCEIISGDDTKTKVLELHEPVADSVAQKIDEMLGFTQTKKNGEGDKKGLNVSLLIGRTDQKDPRSTIRFFRTHLGSVGDLLTQALELRSPKLKSLIFQGDLSTSNLPSRELMKKFNLTIAGCGAHARRPFWRYREEDAALCYYMLRGFCMLSQIETMINDQGRTRETILKMRSRYSKWVWTAIYNRCFAATTGEILGRATYRLDETPDIWPPNTELNKACNYVVKHFQELTEYLSNPHLHYTNNGIERALRIEKCMLSGSKFRKTRNGRAVLDILRTINATCTVAQIDLTDYIRYVLNHLPELKENPKNFTPYSVALHLETLSQAAPAR